MFYKATDSEGRSFGAPAVVWKVGRVTRDPAPMPPVAERPLRVRVRARLPVEALGEHALRYFWSAPPDGASPETLLRWAREHHEKRLRTANTLQSLDLDRRTHLGRDEICLVASFTLTPGPHRPGPLTAADGVGTVVMWLRWTLQTVYGLGGGAHDARFPLAGLRLCLEEARA